MSRDQAEQAFSKVTAWGPPLVNAAVRPSLGGELTCHPGAAVCVGNPPGLCLSSERPCHGPSAPGPDFHGRSALPTPLPWALSWLWLHRDWGSPKSTPFYPAPWLSRHVIETDLITVNLSESQDFSSHDHTQGGSFFFFPSREHEKM